MARCIGCGRPLDADDIGAHRKFVDKMAEEFLCIPCIAAEMKCTEDFLIEKIEFLRKKGCKLFVPKNIKKER